MKNEPTRILLVDDDTMILKLIKRHLRGHFGRDLKVESTVNPGEALSINAHGGFDICITDLDMPAYNGFNLLKTIKATNVLTEVIILTGYPSSNAIKSAFAMGANDYLVKPVQEEELIRTVSFYVERIQRFRREITATKVDSLPIATPLDVHAQASGWSFELG
jgi:two-component system CitB family response regulator/CitB family two-component system response regulator MalR